MQALQQEGYSVHVDYSDNLDLAMFIEESNVRFIATVQENENKIIVMDRFSHFGAMGSRDN